MSVDTEAGPLRAGRLKSSLPPGESRARVPRSAILLTPTLSQRVKKRPEFFVLLSELE